MESVLQLVGLCCMMLAVPMCVSAKSAMHETNGILFVVLGAIFLVGGSIIAELQRVRKAAPSAAQEKPSFKK